MSVTSEVKSRVMTLGNKLARSMSRQDALSLAWALVLKGGKEMSIAGVTFENRQEALRRLAKYQPEVVRAFVVPEPENPVDRKALAVMVSVVGKGQYKLGYIPAGLTDVAQAFTGNLLTVRVLTGAIYGARVFFNA